MEVFRTANCNAHHALRIASVPIADAALHIVHGGHFQMRRSALTYAQMRITQ